MSSEPAAGVQAECCAVLVDEWVRAGVTDAVIAPGSRSTPLVLALDAAPGVRTHVVLDERSAGFVALGLGLATGRPAVVLTTSGTAAVELHPAVVEASLAGVPLLAVTADRPPELHGVGAPQTVEQEGLYGSAPRWAVSLVAADPGGAGAGRAAWRSIAARSAAMCVAGPQGPGPVHLNVGLREPLLDRVEEDVSGPASGRPGGASVSGRPDGASASGRPGGAPWHSVSAGGGSLPSDVAGLLRRHAGGRGLVVAGAGADPEWIPAAQRVGWPVLADPRSGCRLPGGGVVAAADSLLRVPQIADGRDWRPDLVVRVGAPWASKVLGQWLAGLGPDVTQVLIDPWGRWTDPDRIVSEVVAASPAAVAAALSAEPAAEGPSEWAAQWARAEAAAQGAMQSALGVPGALSEPGVARSVVGGVPDGGRLVVSSSMPVRDVEWYGAPRAGLTMHCNRGANGIDGVVSTAVGVAVGSGAPTVALVGDLAFVYDAGALMGAANRDIALTLVVIDNDGGGIFSFLPQAAALPEATFERYWGTPPGVDVAAVAGAYGAAVEEVADRGALDGLLARSHQPGLRVGVVRTSRHLNVAAHDAVHAAVADAVAPAAGPVPAVGAVPSGPASSTPGRPAPPGPGRPAPPGPGRPAPPGQ
jgi:2-succinyl-5-enolpyruvyl-6-hydroxy-3-cyclohexene-1-carboxylate synthase